MPHYPRFHLKFYAIFLSLNVDPHFDLMLVWGS